MGDLDDLIRNLERMKGTRNVIFDELFNVKFMTMHTEFVTIDDMFDATGFKIESDEDFDNIPENELDKFICAHTQFSSWKEMLGKAGEEYMLRELGL